MLEPSEFFALAARLLTVEVMRPLIPQTELLIDRVNPHARNQHRCNRYKHKWPVRMLDRKAQNCTFVAAKQSRHPRQRNRIDIPNIAGVVGHRAQHRVSGRMKAVIHAREQAKRDVGCAFELIGKRPVAQQILKPVAQSLGLKKGLRLHPSAGPYNRVAGACPDAWSRIDGSKTLAKLANEAIAQRCKLRVLGLTKVKVGKKLPNPHRELRKHWALNRGEPAHEVRERNTRDSIGQDEIELVGDSAFEGLHHGFKLTFLAVRAFTKLSFHCFTTKRS